MTILITAPGEFSGAELKTGCYYNAEPAAEGTEAQNRLFHKLLQIFMVSNRHSYNAKTFQEFKDMVKKDYGAGFKSYVYIQDTKSGLFKGRVKNIADVPENIAIDKYGNKMLWGELLSWSKYSKKQRMDTINNVISVMHQLDIKTKEFYEILDQLELNNLNRMAG